MVSSPPSILPANATAFFIKPAPVLPPVRGGVGQNTVQNKIATTQSAFYINSSQHGAVSGENQTIQPISKPCAPNPHSQTRFLYWFTGLSPIATALVTPFMVYFHVRKSPLNAIQRQEMVMQEVSRQITGCALGLLTYFAGGRFTGNLVNIITGHSQRAVNDDERNTLKVVGGTALGFVAWSFVRPKIGTDMLLNWFNMRGETVKSSMIAVGKQTGKSLGWVSVGFFSLLGLSEFLSHQSGKTNVNSINA